MGGQGRGVAASMAMMAMGDTEVRMAMTCDVAAVSEDTMILARSA